MKLKKIELFLFLTSITITTYSLQKELEAVAKEKQKIDKRAHEIERNKQIRISDHAVKQMDERGISRSEVEKTIKFGTKTVNKKDKSVKFLRKGIMVVTDLDELVVITVYASNKKEDDILSDKERSLKSKKSKAKRMPITSESRETKSFIRYLNNK